MATDEFKYKGYLISGNRHTGYKVTKPNGVKLKSKYSTYTKTDSIDTINIDIKDSSNDK